MLKKLYFLLALISTAVHSQHYVDLFSVNYTQSNAASYENYSEKTAISNFEITLTIPIIINHKAVFITGFDFNKNTIQLFPNYNNNSLFLTRVKAGICIQHSEKWSGTYLFLPKVASDYINITTNDLYLGGAIVFKNKIKENLNYKLGIYASNEAYGFFVSPLLGMYYKSPNSKFEMNLTFPTDLDLNYSATKKTKIGIDYSAVGKSYRMTTENNRNSYAENNSLQFSSYIQNNSLFKNIQFRIKAGFSTNDYEVYPINQKNDFRVSAFKFGDHRNQLNSLLSSSLFITFESIYRFDIP